MNKEKLCFVFDDERTIQNIGLWRMFPMKLLPCTTLRRQRNISEGS